MNSVNCPLLMDTDVTGHPRTSILCTFRYDFVHTQTSNRHPLDVPQEYTLEMRLPPPLHALWTRNRERDGIQWMSIRRTCAMWDSSEQVECRNNTLN